MTEIAYMVGFSSASHYTQTSREIIGCTPLKYRKENHLQKQSFVLDAKE